MSRARSRGRRLAALLRHALALGAAAIFCVPLIWVAAFSLRPTGLPPPVRIEWLPAPAAWGNYARIFQIVPLGRYALNSLVVVALAVPITLVVASWAGFAMAQLGRRARRRLALLAILLLMVPFTALWVSRYIFFAALGLVDSLWALAAPALMGTTPFFVLLFYWTFRRVPRGLFEAALLDGAGALDVWARVAMPLARPTTTVVGVLSFSFYWSDFLSPLLFLKSDERLTLPMGIALLKELGPTNWPLLMAGVLVMTLPVFALFLLVQRYFWPEGRLSGFAGR